jgi:nucleotide-binding universal stress UspA family protein
MIVVGVDGSPGSCRALVWAYVEAGLRECGVEVVTAWTTNEPLAREAQRHAVDRVQRQLDRVAPTSCEIVHGESVDVLVRASVGASLLVVGSHDVAGLRHAGQPSVSGECARLASCPCVVVPAVVPERALLRQELVESSAP